MGVAERKIGSTFGNISTLRLSIHSESENWAIISEVSTFISSSCNISSSILYSEVLVVIVKQVFNISTR